MNSQPKRVVIDDVDQALSLLDGKIKKEGTSCTHGPRQRCVGCLPLDPYDEKYLADKGIKHMSFHSYVHKLSDLHGKGTRTKNMLETLNYKINLDCHRHRPFPEGICTECRPPTVTLSRQPFRHVDNIEFENDSIVNEFLNFWRNSRCQRIGFLIGKYEQFTEVPLGIKAVVYAIYEPSQNSNENSVGFEINEENKDKNNLNNAVDQLCSWLGMKRIGWIFTDLWNESRTLGTVRCIRNEDSFLLSASECITAGSLQSHFKNATNYCDTGYFGSKFVTVVASGNSSKGIDLHGYQVSNQCTAMVEANILCPTKTHPELAWAREKPLNEKHYITSVQYTEKNERGEEVFRDGRPMPVEYLLVDVPCGVRKVLNYTFPISRGKEFPVENRSEIGQTQELHDIAKYFNSFKLPDQFLVMASDFHFLLFLLTNNFVEFPKEEIKELAQIVSKKEDKEAKKWATENTSLATLCMLIGEIGRQSPRVTSTKITSTTSQTNNNNNITGGVGGSNSGGGQPEWTCKHCTMLNSANLVDCSMCSLPRS
uniref:MPN domain-containing protein n=1 Tax=Meloidogyne hapla TaxID=6305 RepID=A0A1I8B5E3_MELHA